MTAQLGLSTDNMMLSGRVTERSTYRKLPNVLFCLSEIRLYQKCIMI